MKLLSNRNNRNTRNLRKPRWSGLIILISVLMLGFSIGAAALYPTRAKGASAYPAGYAAASAPSAQGCVWNEVPYPYTGLYASTASRRCRPTIPGRQAGTNTVDPRVRWALSSLTGMG